MNRDGGANILGPQHLLNLSKIEQFTDRVCKPRSSDVWVTLVGFKNVEKVNTSSSFLVFFSLFVHGLNKNYCLTLGIIDVQEITRMTLCDEGFGWILAENIL